MEVREILGLDLGEKRTGIARASNVAKISEPLMTVETVNLIDELQKYAKQHKVEAVAAGLPRNLGGEDTEQTEWVRQFVDKIKLKLQVPLYWQDEALTSVKADALKKNHQRADTDSISAAIILQDFIDTPDADRLMC